MIIEVVGSTGAGKSTLISQVQRQLAEDTQIVTAFDLVAGGIGLSHLQHRTLRNLILDLASIPFFVIFFYRHRAFLVFAFLTLIRYHSNILFTLNYVRSIVRKIGIYEIVRLYGRDRVVIVDEGTIMVAHLLFVFTNEVITDKVFTGSHYCQEEIEAFAELVPLPDVVVYVKAPVEALIQRTLQRDDAPREMHGQPACMVATYVRLAAAMFDCLSETERIRSRVVTVVNDDATVSQQRAMAGHIAESILRVAPISQ